MMLGVLVNEGGVHRIVIVKEVMGRCMRLI